MLIISYNNECFIVHYQLCAETKNQQSVETVWHTQSFLYSCNNFTETLKYYNGEHCQYCHSPSETITP